MSRRTYESLTEEEKAAIKKYYVEDKNSIDKTMRITGLTYRLVYRYLTDEGLMRDKRTAYDLMGKNMSNGVYENQTQRTVKT